MQKARRYGGIAVDVLAGMTGPPDQGRGVLVLGMHRSGTSAIASLIEVLGPSLGDQRDLKLPDRGNQKSYWESTKLIAFQDSLLEKLGGNWDRPPVLDSGWERDWRLVRRAGLARKVFREVYGGTKEWLWKDPRTVLLLPFWRRALRFDPVVVAIFRNPFEVADSLAARDGIPMRQVISLWEAYNTALLENAHGLPVFITSYEDLVSDTVSIARRLSAFLERHCFRILQPTDAVIRSCIEVGLRHNVHSAPNSDADGRLTDPQRVLFSELCEVRGEYSAFLRTLTNRFEPQLRSAGSV
jgi:hypothetical protein